MNYLPMVGRTIRQLTFRRRLANRLALTWESSLAAEIGTFPWENGNY